MPPEVLDALADVSLLQAGLWIVGGVAVIVFIVKGWPWLRRLVGLVDALGDLPEALEQMKALSDLPEVVERIRHQVENDHKTNLREELSQVLDQSNETVNAVARLNDWQQKHEEKSDADSERLDEHLRERTHE